MSISSPFIERPVATTLLLIAATMAGAIAYYQLPVSPLPQIDYPTINISASLPGGSPEVMAASVATPLEKQFTRIAGVTEMTSRSSLGSANITLQFDLNRDINSAARDVQASINASLGYLPANLPTRPRYRKINPSDSPIIVLSLQSDVIPREQLYDLASSVFAQKLAQVKGVGQVGVNGSSLPAVRIELNPQPVSRYNVGMDVVGNFLASANANRPKGALENDQVFMPLLVTDQLSSAKDYKNLIVLYRNGSPIRLSDLGRVIDGTEDVRNIGLSNGRPAVSINVNRQPNANIIDTVERIKALLPQFRAALPPNSILKIDTDRTLTIRSSVEDAERNMIISIVLVVFVVFFFLRNLWATFIPSVSVPVSLIATFGVMYMLGYSLDNLSLMALAIATGFVVDDAIVVIENITRHIEDGMKPMAAALRGAEEIGFTVLSMSVSLIAVFIPILMMPGIVGRLFREFAVVLAVAIFMSMIISLTATPMMCARLLKTDEKHGKLYIWSEKAFDWVLSTYMSALDAVLDHTFPVMLVMLLTIGVNVYLYTKLPGGFFPQQDTGRLQGGVQGQQHISYQAMVEKAKWFEQQVRKDPAVETVNMTLGAGGGGPGGGGSSSAQMNVQLKPLGERKISTDEVIARIRRNTGSMPGAQLFLQNSQDIRIGGRQSNSQYQYTLQTQDLGLLAVWGPRLVARLSRLPQITDIFSDQQISGLSANVTIDRDTASRLGLTAVAVDTALYTAFGQRQVSTMYKSINQYHVVEALQQQWWQSPDYLDKIYVQTPRGISVPLSTFARFSEGITPLQLPHQGQFPATTISFNLSEGYTLDDAVAAISKAEIDMSMPATITGSFAGTAKAFQDSMSTMPLLIGTALLVVYIILGILYESLIHPITIISTLPSAGVGALMALVLFRTELSIIALIGIFLLIGIVKKNAIMMIDFALAAERNEGLDTRESIYQACKLRFRPIMMTTSCALLGGMPLALGLGSGAELRKPLGITIVGGLVVSQMLTLFTTPVIYLYFDKLSKRFSRVPNKHLPGILVPGGAVGVGD
ncbi:MAG TPA: efflux RND transporter permease subunit [Bryobacteraceae bacterium]|jgi:multidrug efflux pump|nr:efflux RND transporter permease subunit [Bryobacteraceae bacterium]